MSAAPARPAALRELAALLLEGSSVRLPGPTGSSPARRHAGYELRFAAHDRAELKRLCRLLDAAGLPHGRPFTKARRTIVPVYGRAAVLGFLTAVGHPDPRLPALRAAGRARVEPGEPGLLRRLAAPEPKPRVARGLPPDAPRDRCLPRGVARRLDLFSAAVRHPDRNFVIDAWDPPGAPEPYIVVTEARPLSGGYWCRAHLPVFAARTADFARCLRAAARQRTSEPVRLDAGRHQYRFEWTGSAAAGGLRLGELRVEPGGRAVWRRLVVPAAAVPRFIAAFERAAAVVRKRGAGPPATA